MHGEGAAGLGQGAQVDGVAHELGLGALGLDDLFAVAGRVHAHDAAAALVEIAEDIAHVLIGHRDLQLAHRLKQHGRRLGHGCLVGEVRGGLERDFGGVNGVVGTIHQGGLQEHHGIAGQHAVQAALAQALFHSREVVLGHGAAKHVLLEDHILLLSLGLENDMDIAELTTAAGLWASASLGIILGAGMLEIGLLTFVLILVTVFCAAEISRVQEQHNRYIGLYLEIEKSRTRGIYDHINGCGYEITSIEKKRDKALKGSDIIVIVMLDLKKRRAHGEILSEFSQVEGVHYLEEV